MINKETVYRISPIFLQNILVSLYGAKLFYERYFWKENKFYGELITNQWMPKQAIHEMQNEKFMRIINYAWNNVPYYRDAFESNCISLKDIRSIDDINKIPLLDKEDIRARSDDIISRAVKKRNIIILNTSGSTGKSLKIHVDLESRRKTYAFVTRYHRWAGLMNSRKNVTFAGRTIVPQSQSAKVYWRYNAAMSNYLFSTYHISDKNMPYYLEKIKKISPNYIDSYPSAIYLLAKYMEQRGISGIYPKVILTSGETLLDYQRETIEKVFGCRIFDHYGCTEQALFVTQCEKGTYHVHPEFGIVEILDKNNKHVIKGQIGRVVCTSFTNMATPLIRYDLGDTASLGEDLCACGRSFPVLEKLSGRVDDYIVTPDGKKVGRLDPIFKGISSVKLAQIIQSQRDKLIVKLVIGNEFNIHDRKKILHEVENRVGPEVKVEVKIVDDIEKSANGKFRSVISEINK